MQIKTSKDIHYNSKAPRGGSYKVALKTSAAATVLMLMALPAHAQVVIDSDADLTNGVNETVMDAQASAVDSDDLIISIAAGATSTVGGMADDDNSSVIRVDGNSPQDGLTITNDGTLISENENEEEVAIFIDNAEDGVTIINNGAISGVDGVITQEGDGLTLTNAGTITGTGEAEDGVINFDRDSDSTLNTITNTADGVITSTAGGSAINVFSLLGSAPGSSDTAAATADMPNAFTGTATITIDNAGTISNTDTEDSESNAITFDGEPGNTSEGSTSSSFRSCVEFIDGVAAPQINCQFDVNVTNSGTISAVRDNAANAAIVNTSDAVLNGTITNAAGGIITGASQAILVNGAHAEHDLAINNAGTISGTGETGRGLVITGAGVAVTNQAGGTISGTDAGLFVAGSTIDVTQTMRDAANTSNVSNETLEDVAVAAVNNTFVNAGTISGTRASVDLSGAGEAVTFEQQGGALTGDFLGSTGFTDALNFTTADFTLTNDILQDVNVNVGTGVDLTVSGARSINGNLESDGELSFVLGTDSLAVSGDTTLNEGSVINVADTNGQVTGADQDFTLITTGGTLVNNSTLATTAVDNSFLLDFVVLADTPNDVVVRSVAAVGDPDPMPDPDPAPMPDPDPAPAPGGLVITAIADLATPTTATPLAEAEVMAGVLTSTPEGGMTVEVASGTNLENPSDDAGVLIELAAGSSHTVDDGDNIDLNNGENDAVINIDGVLTNNDTSDEDTAIFIDNAEDRPVVNVGATGVIQGVNGAIFFEGDEATLTNNGIIEGTGAADEGVVYFDRDADDNTNTIINNGTISSVGGATIGFDSLLGDVPGNSAAADATADAPVSNSGFGTLVLTNTGTISNSDSADDGDSDAININGDAGNTGDGSDGNGAANPRGCLETTNTAADLSVGLSGADITNLNCQVNLTLTNSGTISTARDNAANAAIVIENDAVLIDGSTITNEASGIIAGAANGVIVNGAHAEHDVAINNAGEIIGVSGVGLTITGAGVDLDNSGSIVGGDAGLLVESSTIDISQVLRNEGNGASVATDADMDGDLDATIAADVAVAAVNNTFVNSGTISGNRASVDLSGAGEAVTFEQQGGALTGDFLGSTGFTDALNFTTADFTLTNDILQDVNVNVGTGVDLTVSGARSINGNLESDGALSFVLGTDSLAVSGDTTLNEGSVINVADTNGQVTGAGQDFTLITTGGTLVNNSTLATTAVDNSFLLDFVVLADTPNDVVVRSVAAVGDPDPMPDPDPAPMPDPDPMPDPEPTPDPEPAPPVPPAPVLTFSALNANVGTFGNAIVSAFNAGELEAGIAGQLADIPTEADFASAVLALTPETNNSSSREVFEATNAISGFINNRLNGNRNAGFTAGFADGSATNEKGVWGQVGYKVATQSNEDGFSLTGYDADVLNVAVGYDYALNENTLIGISGGYSQIDVDQNRSANSEDDIELFSVTAYAGHEIGPIFLNGQVGYSNGDVDTERDDVLNAGSIEGSFDVTGFNVRGTAGYDIALRGNGYISPLVGFNFGTYSADDYTETGGLNLLVEGIDTTYIEGKAGFISGNVYEFDNSELNLSVRAAYVIDFDGDVDDFNIGFGTGQSANLVSVQGDENRAEFGLGAVWQTETGFSLGVDFNGEASRNYGSVGGAIRLKYKL